MSSSLLSQSSSSSYHYSYSHCPQEHCQHLYQHCKKKQSLLWLKKLESGPVGLPRCPWARYQGQFVHSDASLSLGDGTCSSDVLMWCGCKKKSILLWGLMTYASSFYQPYHPHHPQLPHYLVNPPHPHQIFLFLLTFIILQPSKII